MQEIFDAMNGYSLRLSLPFLPPPPPQRLSPKRACSYLLYRYASAAPSAVAMAAAIDAEHRADSPLASPQMKKKKRPAAKRCSVLLSNMMVECVSSFMIPSETVVVASMSQLATLKLLTHEIVLHHVADIPEASSGSGGEFSGVAVFPNPSEGTNVAGPSMGIGSGDGVSSSTCPKNVCGGGSSTVCVMAAYGLGIAAYALPRLGLVDAFDGAGHSDAVLSVDTSSDGVHMATGGRDCGVVYWSRTEGPLRYMVGHTDWVRFVKFCSNYGGSLLPLHQLLFSASDDGTVVLWDPQMGTKLACLDAFEGRSIRSFDVVEGAPNGETMCSSAVMVALTLEVSPIFLFELVAPKPHTSGGSSASSNAAAHAAYHLEERGSMDAPHRGTLTALRFAPNGEWILTAAEDETIAVSSVAQRALLWRSTSLVSKRRCISFMNTISCVRVLCCPPQASVLMVCACSSDGHVLLWTIDPRDGRSFERMIQLQIGSLISLDVAKGTS